MTINLANYPKPMNKPRKTLNKLQKEFMKNHKNTKEHNAMMVSLMKMGYCIEQSHKIASKEMGKNKKSY